MTGEAAVIEFFRVLVPARLGKAGEERHLEATAEECTALARRFDLVSLEGLCADVTVRLSGKRGRVRLTGTFEAHVVQSCVVTQEPVATHVKESFNLLFGPQGEAAGDLGAELILSSEAEEVEPFEGGELDMGECVAQYLSLALDPYPRQPGVRVPPELNGELAGQEKMAEGPFSVLQDLKNGN